MHFQLLLCGLYYYFSYRIHCVIFFPLCFWNHVSQNQVSQTQWKDNEHENRRSRSFQLATRNLTHRDYMTRCPLLCLNGVATSLHCITKCCLVSGQHFRTGLPVVSSLFGKTVARLNTVIKVQDGNEKRKSVNYHSLNCAPCRQSLDPTQRRIIKEGKNKTHRSKIQFPYVCWKGWFHSCLVG